MESDPSGEAAAEELRTSISHDDYEGGGAEPDVRMGWFMFDYPDPELVADVIRFRKYYESIASQRARSRELKAG